MWSVKRKACFTSASRWPFEKNDENEDDEKDGQQEKCKITARLNTLFRKAQSIVDRFGVNLQIKIEFGGKYYVYSATGIEMQPVKTLVG